MQSSKIPHQTTAYIFALLSCFLFIFGGFAIVFAVLSYWLANKAQSIYQKNPTRYKGNKRIKITKIIGIIGFILNLIILGITIWTLSTIGWEAWSDEFVRRWNEGLEQNRP